MKKIFSILICFSFLKTNAQKNFSWQIVAEVNWNKASAAGLGWSNVYPEYYIIDTASSLFTKITREFRQDVTSSISSGKGLGIQFNYKIWKGISINFGITLGSNSIKRAITESYGLIDSADVTLQNTGAYQWFDPVNSYRVFKGYGAVNSNGQVIDYIGWDAPDNGQHPNYKNRIPSNETIKFISLSIPVGITFNPLKSKLSFYGEINPIFLLKSSLSPKYVFDPSRITPGPDHPPFHIDKINSVIWQFEMGISYKINAKIGIGLNYKQSFNSLANNDDIKFKSVGLKVTYALPNIKL